MSAFYLNAHDFAGLGLNKHLEWPATDLAIGGKSLRRSARVYHYFEALTAKRALNGFVDFHAVIISDNALVVSSVF